MPEARLAGRVVLVTGAGGALGPCVVEACRAAGATVVAPRREDVDLADLGATQALAGRVAAEHGRVDCVLHLVGGYAGNGAIGEVTDADWAALETRLLRTVLNVTRAFAGELEASAYGRFLLPQLPRDRKGSVQVGAEVQPDDVDPSCDHHGGQGHHG